MINYSFSSLYQMKFHITHSNQVIYFISSAGRGSRFERKHNVLYSPCWAGVFMDRMLKSEMEHGRINKQTEREELRSYTSIRAFLSLALFIWDLTRCLSVIVEKYGFKGRKPYPVVITWSQNKNRQNRQKGRSLQRKLNIWVC